MFFGVSLRSRINLLLGFVSLRGHIGIFISIFRRFGLDGLKMWMGHRLLKMSLDYPF